MPAGFLLPKRSRLPKRPGSAVLHIAAVNYPAAQAHLALVQHGGLAGRDGPLGLLEMQLALAGVGCNQGAGGVGLVEPSSRETT